MTTYTLGRQIRPAGARGKHRARTAWYRRKQRLTYHFWVMFSGEH